MTDYASKPEKRLVATADKKTVKRAQWEAFEFEVESPNHVTVINGSHANPEDHTYGVRVEDGTPVACECAGDTYQDGPCKHRISIAIRQPVIEAASQSTQTPAMTDGGRDTQSCKNGETGCCGPHGDDLSCFECYLEGTR